MHFVSQQNDWIFLSFFPVSLRVCRFSSAVFWPIVCHVEKAEILAFDSRSPTHAANLSLRAPFFPNLASTDLTDAHRNLPSPTALFFLVQTPGIYLWPHSPRGVHMHSCICILFFCTVQFLYYMRVYHRCLKTPACVGGRGLEVGYFQLVHGWRLLLALGAMFWQL